MGEYERVLWGEGGLFGVVRWVSILFVPYSDQLDSALSRTALSFDSALSRTALSFDLALSRTALSLTQHCPGQPSA